MKGTITKRPGARGMAYRVRVDLPPDPLTGERRRRSTTCRTRKEAERQMAQWIADIERGTAVDPVKTSLGDYLRGWLDGLGADVRPVTRRRYRDLLTAHVLPYLGSVLLAKLTPAHVRELQANRLAAGLSSTTVAFLHATLHRALKDAEL